jgi:hypothetical protein
MNKPLTTDELAAGLGLKPQTLRAAICRDGHYCGLRPTKAPNRFLYWPPDSIERLTAGQAREEAPCNN